MPWFRVDDNLAFHHKIVAAGNSAIGLWVRAGSWCAQQLTDGFVPDHMLTRLGTPNQVAKLIKVGLWIRVDGGIEFHQWVNRQPLRVEVDAERDAARERMRSIRATNKGVKNASSQVSESGSAEVPRTGPEVFGNPNPTLPIPTNYFDDFWDAYPRKESKGHARSAFAKAAKKTDGAAIVEAAMAFADRVAGSDKKFIAHPATWLNGERWDDEIVSEKAATGWQSPWVPPIAPAEIADDPERYQSWLADQRKAAGR